MYNMGEDLGVDCRLIEVLDKLLHLWPKVGHEKMAAPHPSHRITQALVVPVQTLVTR
ncbi:hypothetical protein I79_023009 [Cricetulus griseus]|uniref:Uncharacterized protein n=1 Tax=Cricetulus griseus TaxID=10029 RepID=G3IGT3_CRIGR|nr:hypothetical protein I79_023009 [Cricetulus griseus]